MCGISLISQVIVMPIIGKASHTGFCLDLLLMYLLIWATGSSLLYTGVSQGSNAVIDLQEVI